MELYFVEKTKDPKTKTEKFLRFRTKGKGGVSCVVCFEETTKNGEAYIHVYKISVKRPSNSGPDSKFYDRFAVGGFYENDNNHTIIKIKQLAFYILKYRERIGNFEPGLLKMTEGEKHRLDLPPLD